MKYYLFGEAGTGKSAAMKAILNFQILKNTEKYVLIFDPTGEYQSYSRYDNFKIIKEQKQLIDEINKAISVSCFIVIEEGKNFEEIIDFINNTKLDNNCDLFYISQINSYKKKLYTDVTCGFDFSPEAGFLYNFLT